MPKKKQRLRPFNFTSSYSPSPASPNVDKSSRTVNELLAISRRSSAGPSTSRELLINTPSVPPEIREILQIPETPSPAPRRPLRARFGTDGRRLPAGPPPPRSWLSSGNRDWGKGERNNASRLPGLRSTDLSEKLLPGAYFPTKGSLIYCVLDQLAWDWISHREYNQYHLYFIPSHLKAALIHHLSVGRNNGVSTSDLKLILLPPVGVYDDDEFDAEGSINQDISCLDLSGSIGCSLAVKDVTDLLYPPMKEMAKSEDIEDSWDAVMEKKPALPKVLLPNLTHLSLALDPENSSGASWKQLITLSSKASRITHLNISYWPTPCFNSRARTANITSPQGQRIAYGGTTIYSHSIDNDWSEALLILRMISRNFYELEYLDLTGCGSWFKALTLSSGHDLVDWAGNWGKIRELKLLPGWKPVEDSLTSEQAAYVETNEDAAMVERHIRLMRAGKGTSINVDRIRSVV